MRNGCSTVKATGLPARDLQVCKDIQIPYAERPAGGGKWAGGQREREERESGERWVRWSRRERERNDEEMEDREGREKRWKEGRQGWGEREREDRKGWGKRECERGEKEVRRGGGEMSKRD